MDELSSDAADPVGEPAGDDAASRLAPRVPPASRTRRRNPFALASLVVIVVALVAVVMMGLGDAAVFFRNADEAVAQRSELGDRRFRVQGLVDGDSVTDTTRGVDFVITHNGVEVTVAHEGDPPDLFQPGIPVVLEGRWARVDDPEVVAPVDALPTDDGWYFASDRFFVKHTEVYAEEHPERTEGYEDDEGERGGSEAGPGR